MDMAACCIAGNFEGSNFADNHHGNETNETTVVQ